MKHLEGTSQDTTTQKVKGKTFEEYSDQYNRVNTNAQTRLTVSAFLGSACLGIFGIFLPNSLEITRTDPGSTLAVIVEGFVGCASVMFLLMSAALSIILIRLGDLNFKFRKALKDGDGTFKISDPQKKILDSIIRLYDGVYILHYLGLIAVLISLPIMGFHINQWVGRIILVALGLVILGFWRSLRFVFLYRTYGQ